MLVCLYFRNAALLVHAIISKLARRGEGGIRRGRDWMRASHWRMIATIKPTSDIYLPDIFRNYEKNDSGNDFCSFWINNL